MGEPGPAREPSFVTDIDGPPRRCLYLSHTGVAKSGHGQADWLGWALVVSEPGADGEESPVADYWEMTLLEIFRYFELFASQSMVWRWRGDGAVADLRSLQPTYDRSRYFDRAVRVVTRADECERICFNLYDDGLYRFVLERSLRENGLSVWLPAAWSAEPLPELARVEQEARARIAWLGEMEA